ncbi:MAG: hypothetical protein GY796_25770 [Chloroflexi bacterium]|nr:hypothetical protein [Chloroflexota bacterium]
MSSFPEELSATLLRWRQAHPGWGPVTLCQELEQHPAFNGQKLPSQACISRFLKEQGLTKRYERHQELPQEEKATGLPQQHLAVTIPGARHFITKSTGVAHSFISAGHLGGVNGYILPCSSLDNQPPLVAYPQAHHSGRSYRLEWEAKLLDMQRIDSYLERGCWFRRVASNGIISLGGTVYYVGSKWKQQQIEVKFDPDPHQFRCFDADAQLLKTFPLKGISMESLMGDVFPLVHFPEAFEVRTGTRFGTNCDAGFQ